MYKLSCPLSGNMPVLSQAAHAAAAAQVISRQVLLSASSCRDRRVTNHDLLCEVTHLGHSMRAECTDGDIGVEGEHKAHQQSGAVWQHLVSIREEVAQQECQEGRNQQVHQCVGPAQQRLLRDICARAPLRLQGCKGLLALA